MNVAFGGSLHQHIHEVPSEAGYAPRFDHREDKTTPLEVQYGPAHSITLKAGGILANLTGQTEIEVNSLHGQGVDRVGQGLSVDARALDGTVEALHVEAATNFAYAVQWHPEWQFWDNPTSQKLFKAFGDAVRAAAHPA
jgi:putative glutamine amidotransferase